MKFEHYIVFTFPIFYRECYLFRANPIGPYIKLTQKQGPLHQVVKIKCHVSKMDFFLTIPIQLPLLIKR